MQACTPPISRIRGRSAVALAVVVSVTLAIGCDDDDDDRRDAGSIAVDDGGAGDASGPLADGAVAALSDAEIAGVVVAINAAKIVQAELAVDRAVRPDVRAYAQRMIDDHTAALQEQDDVLEGIGISPTESALSRTVEQQANVVTKKLAELSGAEFDASYMNAQILMHAEALDILQTRLMPSATNTRYLQFLVDLRDAVVGHLDSARAIFEEIDGGTVRPPSP